MEIAVDYDEILWDKCADEESIRFFREVAAMMRELDEESWAAMPGIPNNILPAEPIQNLVGMADLINAELADDLGVVIPDIIVEKRHEM